MLSTEKPSITLKSIRLTVASRLKWKERLFRQYKKHKLRWARGTGVRRSEEEYEKRLLEDDDGSEEEDTLEKAWKDHQMMRNSRKMRRAKGGKNKIFNK